MKSDIQRSGKILAVILSASAALHAASAFAQQTNYYYINPNGGTWDTTSSVWGTTATSTTFIPWVNGVNNIANITSDGSSAITLTLNNGDITAYELNFYPTTITSPGTSGTETYTLSGNNNLILSSGIINEDYPETTATPPKENNSAGIINSEIDNNIIAGSVGSPTNLTVDAIGIVGSTGTGAFGDTTLNLKGSNTFTNLYIGGGVNGSGQIGYNTVMIDSTASLPAAANVYFTGTQSAFAINGSSSSPITVNANTFYINPGVSTYTKGAFIVGIGATTGNTLNINGQITGAGDLQFSAGFSGDSGLGTGTVVLNAQSNYAGETLFNAGVQTAVVGGVTTVTQAIVQLGINNALPSGTDLVMTYTQGNGGIFDLHGFNQTIGSLSTVVNGGPSYITNYGSVLSTLTISGSDSPGAYNDTIIDGYAPVALVRAGSGTTILTNSANTYSGGTQILGGVLSISADGDLGEIGYYSPTNSVVINGGTLAVTGNGFTMASNRNLALGPASGGSGVGTINLALNTNFVYNGTISDYGAGTGGTGGLTLTGAGTLTLGGTNTYSGPTLISGGTLTLSSSGSLGSSSAVTIALAGTLNGTGAANGSVAVNGTIAPGSSTAIGTLSVGSLALNSGGAYTWKLGDTTQSPGSGWDFINVAGGITVNSTSGSPFVLDAVSPSGTNFDNTTATSWVIATAGSTIPAFNSNQFSVNSLLGAPGNSASFTITSSGDNLILNYSPGSTQFYYWMKNNGGGTGNWDTSSNNWYTNSSTGPWANSTNNGAVFQSGSGTVTLTTSVTSSGVLFQVGGYTIAGSSTLNTPAVQVFNAGQTDTITAPVSGANFTKSGAGTLILSNTSNSLSGTTLVGDGILQANVLSLSDTAISLENSATLIFDQSTPGNYTANIGGTGNLIKQNVGDLTLSGTNSFTGSVSVTAGTLTIGSDAELGNTNNTLTLNGATLQTSGAVTSARLMNLGTSTTSSPTASIDLDGQTDILNGGLSTASQMTMYNGGTLTVYSSVAGGSLQIQATSIGGTHSQFGFAPSGNTPGMIILNGVNLTVGNPADVTGGNSGEVPSYVFGPQGSVGTGLTLENGASLTIAGSTTGNASLDTLASLTITGSNTITLARANTASSVSPTLTYNSFSDGNTPITLNGTLNLAAYAAATPTTYTGSSGTYYGINATSLRVYGGPLTLTGNSTIQTYFGLLYPSLAYNISTTGSPYNPYVGVNFAVDTGGNIITDNGYATTFQGDLTSATASFSTATVPNGIYQSGVGFNGSNITETGLWTIGNSTGTQGISIQLRGTSIYAMTVGNIVVNPYGQLVLYNTYAYGFSGQTISINGAGSTTTSGALLGDTVSGTATAPIDNSLSSTVNLATSAVTSIDAIDASGSSSLTLGGQYNMITLYGNLTGAGTLNKQGTGVLVLDGTNSTATGATQIGNGTVIVGGSSYLTATLPTGNLSLSETATALLDSSAAGDILTFQNTAQTIGNLASSFASSSVAITQTINLNGSNGVGTVLTINETGATTFGNTGTVSTQISSITGIGSIVLSSASTGTLTFDQANTYSGGTTIDGGTLKLDFTATLAPTSNILASGGAITMGGGTLLVNGKASGGSSQTVASLAVIPGASAIVDTSNGSASTLTVTSGTIARSVGGTLDFTLPTSGAVTFTATPALTGGILGGWATVSGASWATLSGSNIAAYSGATSISSTTALASGTNYDVAGSLSASGAANSLRFTNTSSAAALSLTGIVPVTTGGILIPATVTSTDSIAGGTLEGASGADLVVIQNSASTMTIGSTIADHSSATGLTKSGSGTLALTGTNSYSGTTQINTGTLRIGSAGSAGSLGSGSVVDNATLSFDRIDTALSVANLISGSGAVTQIGAGTTTLTAANTFSGQTTISAGTLQLGNAAAVQNSTVSIGATNGLAFSPSIGTFTLGGLSGSANELLQATGGSAATIQAGNNNASTSYSGVLSGSGGLTKIGAGTLIVSGANLYSGATAANGGTLELNFSATGAPASNILPSGSALSLGGGSLLINGAATGGGSSQAVASLTINSGASTVVDTANSSVASALTITSSSIVRNLGGTVDFTPPSGTQSSSNGIVTSASNTNGILGGWATVGGADWATVAGGTIVGLSTQPTNYTNDTWTAGANTTVTVNDSPSSNSTTNSLRFASTTTGNLVTLSGTNVITSGGILISSAVTAATTITGGTLEGPSGGDLIVNQNSVSNFTLSSSIADNGSPTGLTKSGAGTLVLGTGTLFNSDSFTGNVYINQGTILLNASLVPGEIPSGNIFSGNLITFGSNAAGTTPTLNLNGLNATVAGLVASGPALFEGNSTGFSGTPTLTITGNGTYNYAGTLIDGAPALAITISGNGTQILSGTDSWTGLTTINSGGLQIGNGGATGALGSARVVDDSVLTFDLSSSPTVANQIQGTGQLYQIGTGTTTITDNANSYNGGTFVSAGTLVTTGGGIIGPGPLALSAVSGVSATASLGTTQSVTSISNTTAVGGTTRVTVASGKTLTSSGALTDTGALNINTAGQSSGTVVFDSAPTLNANSGVVINSGTVEFNLPSSDPATVQSGVTVTVATPATLQLAGSSSALSNAAGTVAANVNNHGAIASGGGLYVTGATETVGIISGTGSPDVNGATIFDGDTVVGNGSTATNLSANQILQNSLFVNAESIVTIEPTGSISSGVVTSTAAVASDSTATTTADFAATGSGDDSFTAIESALGSSSTLPAAISALRELVQSDSGMKLSAVDDVILYRDYQFSQGSGTLVASAGSTPGLLRDLTADGLSSSEITALIGSSGSAASLGIGSLSPTLGIGSSGAAAVPEPSSLLLLGLGVLGAGAVVLNRRRASVRQAA